MILTRMQETAARYPDRTAIRMKTGDGYESYTYREMLRRVASAAQAFTAMGIRKGDRVALLSENRPEWAVAYLAVVAQGAVIVPFDAQLTEKEVAVLLANSGASAVCVSESCRSKVPPDGRLQIVSFDPGPGMSFTEMMAAHPAAVFPAAPGKDDLAAILYTSGTTGDPKGVMLSHGNLASNARSIMKLNIVLPTDNILCILPFHHTYPSMACIVLPFSQGTTVTLLNSLKGPDIVQCIRETSVTVMLGVPQFFAGLRRSIFDEIRKKPAAVRLIVRALLGLNGLLRRSAGINIGKKAFGAIHSKFGPSFRLFSSGGARLDPDVFTDMTRLGFTIIEAYGLTETSPAATFNPLEKQKAGSIGIPVPDVEVRIAEPDESGQGEIAIKGPNVMLGYYQKPRETAEVLRDGWFYSGDLGYRDADGYFFITGRSKEMIVLSSGKKIFPEELEKYYRQIPAIKEICLIQGERGLEAAVVPDFDYLRRMNLSNSRETIAFEIEDLAKDLPPYKRITGLKIFKDALPATRLGKLKRSKVAELYLQIAEQGEKLLSDQDRELLDSPNARKLMACIAGFSQKKTIAPDDNLELDLGLDSLARVELVVSIEQTFGIRLPESFGSEIFTVRDTVQRMQDLLASGSAVAAGHVRMTWTEILSQDLTEEARSTVQLESGIAARAVQFSFKLALTAIMRTYGRLSIAGRENLPESGPYIIAPNHLSLADMPAVAAAVPWRTASQFFSLGATEYFHGQVMSLVSKLFHVIPVDMDAKLYSALQLSAHVLRKGKILCVFPEGSRSRDGRIKEFKKGVGIVAKELNVPIVPVAISGTYEMLPSGKHFPRPGTVTVSFGKPVSPDGTDYDTLVRTVYDHVVKMLPETVRPYQEGR